MRGIFVWNHCILLNGCYKNMQPRMFHCVCQHFSGQCSYFIFPENNLVSGVFREYKMGTLVRNGLKYQSTAAHFWWEWSLNFYNLRLNEIFEKNDTRSKIKYIFRQYIKLSLSNDWQPWRSNEKKIERLWPARLLSTRLNVGKI